jgi:hypothetical protein
MAGYRKYILIIILLAALAAVFFALPDSRPPASDTFAKCSACHPGQADELKRAFFHTSMQCTACHAGIPKMTDKKPLDHTSFNAAYY